MVATVRAASRFRVPANPTARAGVVKDATAAAMVGPRVWARKMRLPRRAMYFW